MTLDAYLDQFKVDAEERMGAENGGSTVNLWRKTGESNPDANGYDVPEWAIELSDLPCRIGSDKGAGQSRTISTPGGDVTLAVRVASFPAATTNLADGDLLEVTAGRLVGSFWQIVEADDADQQTARRVPVIATERQAGML